MMLSFLTQGRVESTLTRNSSLFVLHSSISEHLKTRDAACCISQWESGPASNNIVAREGDSCRRQGRISLPLLRTVRSLLWAGGGRIDYAKLRSCTALHRGEWGSHPRLPRLSALSTALQLQIRRACPR